MQSHISIHCTLSWLPVPGVHHWIVIKSVPLDPNIISGAPMKVEITTDIPARPGEILDYLVDTSYYEALQQELEKVTEIELIEVGRADELPRRRVVRYTAPTELPRFLRRFKDKAPDEVHWTEVGLIDKGSNEMRYEIVAEAPAHWRDYYRNRGLLTVTDNADGTSRLHLSLDYSLDVTGFGYLLERSLRSEIRTILQAQADVLRRRFAER